MSDRSMVSDSKPCSHAAFLEHLNSKFTIQGLSSEPITLELVELSDLQRTDSQQMYAVKFRGPAAFVLEQRTYQLQHDALGTLDLFLVPIAQDGDGTYYEAVFNQLLTSN